MAMGFLFLIFSSYIYHLMLIGFILPLKVKEDPAWHDHEKVYPKYLSIVNNISIYSYMYMHV